MNKTKWIVSKIQEGMSSSELYKLYDLHKEETGSELSKENYRSYVRKLFRREGDSTVAKKRNLSKSDVAKSKEVIEKEITKDSLEIKATLVNVNTLEELIERCEIDTSVWLPKEPVTFKQWQMGYKDQEGNGCIMQLSSVKAMFVRIGGEEGTDTEVLESLIKDAKKFAPEYPTLIPKKAKSGNALEISLFDHHMGQLSWGEETGDRNYDLKIAYDMAMDSISDVLNKARPYDIDQIIIPIGNDWFNVNDKTNTTVKGTPQAEDERWQKTFVRGREVWVSILELACSEAPVKGLWIPGNHDEERSFHLCDSLYCWFNNSDIEIDHSPKPQKVVTWGSNVCFYTHGDKEAAGAYPSIFATMFPMEYSMAKYRMVHLGHLHHSDRKGVQVTKDSYSVDIRVKSALVPTNAWSAGKGLRAIARTEAEVWNKEDGLVADLYHNV